LTIISAVLSLAVGYGFRYFWKKRERKTADEMVKRGLIWKNAPFVLKLSLVSLGTGLLFGAISINFVENVSIMTWMMYVPFMIIIGVAVVSYLARQFPKASLFILGIIIAAYLLLSPVLGIRVEPGTLVSLLFSISPLQRIENMYTNIIANELLSALGYVALIGLAGVTLALNLFVYTPKASEASKDDAGGELVSETA